ncbi:type II toxin-antitoxin system RelE/ParE family toxin [Methylobacterium sp. Gmos1]
MANLVRRPRARRDLLEIWNFIAEANEAAADGVLDRIEAALVMLAENPLAGRARPDLAASLRSFPAGSYLIFYQPIERGIEIVRILSGYRDIRQGEFQE